MQIDFMQLPCLMLYITPFLSATKHELYPTICGVSNRLCHTAVPQPTGIMLLLNPELPELLCSQRHTYLIAHLSTT